MKKIITKEVEIKIPLTPNFIEVGDTMVPVADFREKEIKAIAKEWTKELLTKRKGI